jgi:acetoin utilization protein AcuC
MFMRSTDFVSLIYHPDLLQYDFGPHHPLRPERIELGLDLLRTLNIWNAPLETCMPVAASDDLLSLIHDRAYIAAVRAGEQANQRGSGLGRFGLASSDNPPFANMHYAASLVAGGAAEAARAVMKGELDHVFHPTGGLHHAQRERASGFCIYNDPALAAAVAAEEFGARVAYIDFDCHHGDGVQWLFYDSPSVLTVSFHESGRFLFPGTGGVEERGEGAGLGYAVNVPFMPFTSDASWIDAILTVVPPLIERFAPDLLLSVHGCDTHIYDPLTHLSLTTEAFVVQARLAHDLAHTQCNGRWIAFGSGGYDWRRVVPRSWAIVWSEMSGRELPSELPPEWLFRWASDTLDALPGSFRDDLDLVRPARLEEIESANRETVATVIAAAGIR